VIRFKSNGQKKNIQYVLGVITKIFCNWYCTLDSWM